MRLLTGLLAASVALGGGCTSGTAEPTDPPADVSTVPPVTFDTERLLAELELESLAAVASRLRRLEFLRPVVVEITEDADYRARVNELTAAPLDVTPDQQSSWLRLLGLLPEGANTYSAASRLLQTTVAFYDAPFDRILVRASAGVDPYVESVVVHELVHALQHQHFGEPGTILLDGDLGYVYAALIEGDAERISRRFIGELPPSDFAAYEEGRLAASEDAVAIRNSTPRYVLDSLARPVEDGVRFLQGVDDAVADGYFEDLDRMSSLPPTSEVVVYPGANPEAADVALRPVSVLPYERLPIEGTLGVGRLRVLLGQRLDFDTTEQASTGWDGDRLDIRVSGDDVILAYAVASDSSTDAQELAAAFRLFLDTGPADGSYTAVRVAGDRVLVLAASDPSVEERLEELFGDFGEEIFLVQVG